MDHFEKPLSPMARVVPLVERSLPRLYQYIVQYRGYRIIKKSGINRSRIGCEDMFQPQGAYVSARA